MDPHLPINQRRDEIESALRAHQVVVVCGETGSGKTTQLPQICLSLGRGAGTVKSGRPAIIGHTQPRRLAARAVAARLAEETGTRLGGLVGVKVRFQDTTSRETRVKLMTDGLLLAELAADPRLGAYDTLIIDEAHERSLNIDFLLGVLRGLLPARPDLKLIITSATIEPRRFAAYFARPEMPPVPIVEVSGRTFPVEIRYRPPPGRERDDQEARAEAVHVAEAVEELCDPRLPEGDILVFLPGEREIRQAADALRRDRADVEVLPLFARLTSAEQDRIFHPSPSGSRRVILATNIAETSLTVPGIRYVVDTGLARLNRYDPARKVQTLPIEPVSRASAAQRAGRCGRVAEGVCIRLYSRESFESRPAFTDPEIRRVSLAGVILQMRALGLGDAESFPFLEPPESAAISDGYATLFELGVLDAPDRSGKLTDIGLRVARLPVDPRIGRMLLAGEAEGSLREVLILAGALSIQDPRERPLGKQDDADRAQLVFRHDTSDFFSLLKLWEQYAHVRENETGSGVSAWCRRHFVSAARMREWDETHRQLVRLADELGLSAGESSATEDSVHRALLTGLITHVACRQGDAGSHEYRGVRGNIVSIFPGSTLFKKAPRWIMAAEVVQTSRLFARTVARIVPEWIEELAGHMFQHQFSDRHLDPATGEPCAWERVTMSGIVVVPRRRTALASRDPASARDIFIREALAQCRWEADLPFMRRNRDALRAVEAAEAKLRTRGLGAEVERLAAWLDERLPPDVRDPSSFLAWWGSVPDQHLLDLPPALVLGARAAPALDTDRFPDEITLGAGEARVRCPLSYALAPGQDHDGVTISVPLTDLPLLTPERARWLVPGYLSDMVLSLLRQLPRSSRATLESGAELGELAAQAAGLMDFAAGDLGKLLSEAVEVLTGVRIAPDAWNFRSLPAHLVLRVRVVDHHRAELGNGRDITEVQERFAPRVARARTALARAAYQRNALTDWPPGTPLNTPVSESDGQALYPAFIDHTGHVSLTLLPTRQAADAENRRGIRRLFVIACAEEVEHTLRVHPQWDQLARWYSPFGDAAKLRDELTCLAAERSFMAGRDLPLDREQFEGAKQDGWGRLVTATREVADLAARTLEPRAKVAHRLSGGTPRLWAASVADIREHAAYLMPPGFLLLAGWERLRQYPRYAEAMRDRLFRLREDGSGAETELLARFAPHWKRFTGWVAQRMSVERSAGEHAPDRDTPTPSPVASTGKSKAPLPPARRAAPRVNLEAGEWAMQPGSLTPAVQAFRWALEEARVGLFAPELASQPSVTLADLDTLWSACGEPGVRPKARR